MRFSARGGSRRPSVPAGSTAEGRTEVLRPNGLPCTGHPLRRQHCLFGHGECDRGEQLLPGAQSTLPLRQCYLQSSDFIQFLSSTEVSSKASYFLSQQHQQLESALWLMLGPEGKVSTPFDFADAISGHLTLSSFGGLLECLIDFALTVPETAQLSSEEIFVGCCLLAAEKANS